jgi:hypothetical protein
MPGSSLRSRCPEDAFSSSTSSSRVTHRVRVDGPLAVGHARIVRKSIEKGLPDDVDRLAILAAEDRVPLSRSSRNRGRW